MRVVQIIRRIVIFLSITVIALSGCSSSILTRTKAKEIIEQSDNYKPQKRWIPLAGSEVDACVKHGYLKWAGFAFSWQLSVTEQGRPFFDGAGGRMTSNILLTPLTVMPAVPIKPHVIQVTGITDGDNGSKIVEYQWDWDFAKQPQDVKDLIFKNNPANVGKATLKLYDDGWRVVKFE